MSNFYSKIESILSNSTFLKEFENDIKNNNDRSLFHNLNQTSKSLLLAHAFKKSHKNIIFVTADDKIAEDYLDDLHLLVGEENAHFLPDFEVLPYEQRSPHFMIRAQRIKTLTATTSAQPAIFTTSVRSFLRKITDPKIFTKNIIRLEKSKNYNPDLLVSNLVGMGYENQFQVSKVGEIARRGGIIDVFSPNFYQPIRIEFFDDEIESIRPFDVTTQRSENEDLGAITIIPSREFSLHDIETDEYFWNKIHQNGFYDGIELDISFLLPNISSFVEYFDNENCLIFWDEFHFFKSYHQELLAETTDLFAKSTKDKKTQPQDIFEDEKFIQKTLKSHCNYFLAATAQDFAEVSREKETPFAIHENLHGNLGVLDKKIAEKIAQGYRIFIQSDNESQRKRMMNLLPNFDEKIDFTVGVFQHGFDLKDTKFAVYTDHEIFNRYRNKNRPSKFSKNEALIDYESLKPGDYIVHINHGIGIYAGLKKMSFTGNKVECLVLHYAQKDVVYVPNFQLSMVSKFVSEEGIVPIIHKLGSKKWESAKKRARKQIELVAKDLVKLYAERKIRRGIAFERDSEWQIEMENSFIYEETPDQIKSITEIKKDMETAKPMERLLCGDVGFGKTEVAIRAAFKAVLSGFQVAILVPTTLLAEQHFLVFKERLAQYPVKIAMISRFRTKTNIQKDLLKVAGGEIDIIIGTHRLLSKDVKFKKIGLLIIDEEHRFGVHHKDNLRKLKSNVDTLYMSATPIPRTMSMALSKLKELSLIRTSPKARLPIRTVIVPFDREIIKEAIAREVSRGGQVFFLHNRVQTIEEITAELRKMLPTVRFAIGHGQLPEKQLETVTLDFAHHKFDVLVATTIIESGIDIPNANTMIVNRADMFGLAQLYQIRGRVGRSNRRAYAYFIIPSKINEDARKRLETLIEYESLGSGYQIAMRDMELRGAGTLLGNKQSGILHSIGFNYYNKLLEKAIESFENNEFSENWYFEEQPLENVKVDFDYYFPKNYIADEKIRLKLYREIMNFQKIEQFENLKSALIDRFGEIPEKAKNVLIYHKIRFFTNQTHLKSVKISQKNITLEFDNKSLPSRDKLYRLTGIIDLPIHFSTVKNFEISFDFEKKAKLYLNESIKIIKFIAQNFKE
ncbi:MAG: transcription-repair coupling factor [Candidatus Cloacimonetes bacterium]|jgi:transcription-repair coupling factor (superfamily II helicase)|nr:transcription-repair coupling factor [Candidatus Cloacimonadota bacterium]MBT6993599.1 transcription-repair coupling factor [Candidatus Cloacimonadota bacterium]